ncbi:hypothetical protein E4U31_007718 [Claviceps sp. LM219 group G6]|nr:hypothetical protein E4U15_003745 [Claviceps sp. LM218 group G6]KAG6090799.1 hypothetical protein E4U31_007718 [Claviceps sp. LM219 group G6]
MSCPLNAATIYKPVILGCSCHDGILCDSPGVICPVSFSPPDYTPSTSICHGYESRASRAASSTPETRKVEPALAIPSLSTPIVTAVGLWLYLNETYLEHQQ